ncbi:hypothetical protein ACVJMY_001454 [Bradyrhizobium diazoefficiens]
MLMTKERRPAIRTLRGWATSVLQEVGAIRECTAGCRTAPTRTPAIALMISLVGIHRQAFLPTKPQMRSQSSWIR